MSEWILTDIEQQLEERFQNDCGGSFSALQLLKLTEPLDDQQVEGILDAMTRYHITLDVSQLPPVTAGGSTALRLKQEAQFQSPQTIAKELEANDPLRLYLQEVANTPAAGDVQLYAERYRSGEHHLAEAMVNLCLSRVLELALTFTGHGVLLLDLIQEGSMGLWECIPAYEDGDFMAHAQWWICQAMARSVFLAARSGGVGQMLRQNMEAYLAADQRLLVSLGRNPTVEEIAQELHISSEECAVLEKMVSDARTMERAKPETEEKIEQEEDQAVEDTAYFQMRQRIEELLSGLSAEDAMLLKLRFGLDGKKPMTPVQTGEILNLTPQEVVSREAAALEKLRNP